MRSESGSSHLEKLRPALVAHGDGETSPADFDAVTRHLGSSGRSASLLGEAAAIAERRGSAAVV